MNFFDNLPEETRATVKLLHQNPNKRFFIDRGLECYDYGTFIKVESVHDDEKDTVACFLTPRSSVLSTPIYHVHVCRIPSMKIYAYASHEDYLEYLKKNA